MEGKKVQNSENESFSPEKLKEIALALSSTMTREEIDLVIKKLVGDAYKIPDLNPLTEIVKNSKGNLKMITMNYLHYLGIYANFKGYKYICDAIIMIVERNNTNNIYNIIAKKYNVEPYSVEHSIRYAKKVALKKGNLKNIFENPTNKQFIVTIANQISFELENYKNNPF